MTAIQVCVCLHVYVRERRFEREREQPKKTQREGARIEGRKWTLQDACGLEMHDVKIFPGHQLMIFLLNPLAVQMVLEFLT